MDERKKLLTINDALGKLKAHGIIIGSRHFRRKVRDGEVPGRKIWGKWYITPDYIDKLINNGDRKDV